MPFVRLVVTSDGLTREKKAELVRRTTAALVDILEKNSETTHVVIESQPADSWGIAGELVDERRARGGTRATPQSLGVALAETFGVRARDRREEARASDVSGARAALETFYYAFNQRSAEALGAVWAPDESVLLSNPVGGVRAGISDIQKLYARIFEASARIWVEYFDVTEYAAGGHALCCLPRSSVG